MYTNTPKAGRYSVVGTYTYYCIVVIFKLFSGLCDHGKVFISFIKNFHLNNTELKNKNYSAITFII